MKNKKKYTVTIEIDDVQSIQACDRLLQIGQLNTLVSLLVDLEIPRYADGSALVKEQKQETKSIPTDLVNLLYDIKEVAEEIKDRMAEVPSNTPPTNLVKETLIEALEVYGTAKKGDISTQHISTVAVVGNAGHVDSGSSLSTGVVLPQEVEEVKTLKKAEPTKVSNDSFKNKLAKMKKLKG